MVLSGLLQDRPSVTMTTQVSHLCPGVFTPASVQSVSPVWRVVWIFQVVPSVVLLEPGPGLGPGLGPGQLESLSLSFIENPFRRF